MTKSTKNDGKWYLTKVKRACAAFAMLADGDVISVGVSGGKDSSALLYIMRQLQQHLPVSFDVRPVYVDLGIGMNLAPIEAFCGELGYELSVVQTQIREVVFEVRKEKNPCSLCAKMRKGALVTRSKELGCNKMALGHHLDDAVETFFLNLLYTGKLGSFSPNIYLDRMDIHQIRPLVYLRESTIASLVRHRELPVVKNRCEMDGLTKREEIKDLMKTMETLHPDFMDKCLNALQNVDWNGIWASPESE